MTTEHTDGLDLVDEILRDTKTASGTSPVASEDGASAASASDAVVPASASLASATAGTAAAASPARSRRWRRRGVRAAKLVLTFGIASLATFVLFAAVALGVSGSYANRVLPGVHVGTVDISGLSRDEAIAKVRTSFAYLDQGRVTITTPLRSATITYQDAGRGPDAEYMVDEAMAIGHTGDPFSDAVYVLRSALGPQSVEVVARLDATAVATHVRELVESDRVAPRDALVTVLNGSFGVSPGMPGSGLDETAISGAIVEQLSQSNTPADFKVGNALVAVQPDVTDTDARNAVAAAERMIADLELKWNGDITKSFKVDAQTVRGWIYFRTNPDGSYGPAVDTAAVQAYLGYLAPKMVTKAIEPLVIFNAAGKPAGLKNGQNGAAMDVGATSKAVDDYLHSRAAGGAAGGSLVIVPAAVEPVFNLESLNSLAVQGSWTTVFFPGITNGNGANIRVPAVILNGQIVGPGQHFSFLRAVGPVDRAHGYTLGGVIKNGKSDHTGAMGGGICSASTTMFNAAARAGLQIDERNAHQYYIDRYPVGLDATVFSNGFTTYDMRWTNDTPNPIIIRAWTTKSSKGNTITVQLWSLPTNRKVTFTPAFKANVVKASDHTVYTTKLKPGEWGRAEFPTNGFTTSRSRTVKDATGKVIHTDTWNSHYVKVDGLLVIGKAPAQAPTPAPDIVGPPMPYTVPAAPGQASPRGRRTVR